MKSWAEWLYKSKAWTQCRMGFMQSKFFLCGRCGGSATIAHHKEWLTPENVRDPEITLSWDNLEALCHDCHNREHLGSSEVTREDVMFDEDGQLIKVGELR